MKLEVIHPKNHQVREIPRQLASSTMMFACTCALPGTLQLRLARILPAKAELRATSKWCGDYISSPPSSYFSLVWVFVHTSFSKMPSDQGPSSLHPLQDVSANQEPQSHKFDSYADYLRALLKVYPDKMLTALLAYLNSRKFRSGYKVTFEDEIPQIVHIKHGRCHAYWPTSFPSFDEYLAHPATLPQYQFILVTINNPRRNPYSAQFGNLVNSLGLTFDIPPTIWCQLLYKTPPPGCHSGSYTDYSTKPCQSDSRCFSLGGHLVYITDPSDKSTFKTGS